MNDVDQSLQQLQMAEHARRSAAHWLGAFETALASQDAEKIGALFHDDCHWRDVLAFTWHFTAVEGRENVAARLAAEQEHAAAHGFHLPLGRKPPRKVRRVGIDCIEAIFEFETAVGRGAGIIRLSPTPDGGDDMKAWLISTTLEELKGHEEKIGANRPSGAAYSRNFGGDNWDDVRRKARAYDDREPAVIVVGGAQAGLSSPRGSISSVSIRSSSRSGRASAIAGGSAITLWRCTTRSTSITCHTWSFRRPFRHTFRRTCSGTGSSSTPMPWRSTAGRIRSSSAALGTIRRNAGRPGCGGRRDRAHRAASASRVRQRRQQLSVHPRPSGDRRFQGGGHSLRRV